MFKRLIVSKTLRRRVSLIVALVIILPFMVFFSATGRAPSRGPGGAAGVMFGKPVPWETFQEEQGWMGRRLEEPLAGLPESLRPTFVRQYTWERLMLLAEAQRQHLRVADTELAGFIQQIPAFQENGRFLPERYQRYVRAIGTTPQAFEASLRRDLLLEKLLNAIKTSVTVTDDEVKAAYTAAREQLRASLILIDPASFRTDAASGLTEEAVRADYDAHPNAVRVPEQIALEYAGASRDELLAHDQPSDAEVTAYYADHRDRWTKADGTPKPIEEVRDTVRQALQEERVHKQLTVLALDLQDDVDAHVPFDEIVKTRALVRHAAGPLPADSFGGPGAPEPAVLQAVAGLKEGETSEVIRGDAGVYLARVTQRIASRVPPFEEVHGEIRERLVTSRAGDAAAAHAHTVREQLQDALKNGTSFDEAARTLGLSPIQPPPFTRTDPIEPLGPVPAVNAAAFAAVDGALTDVIETPSQLVLIMAHERLAPDAASFTKDEQARLREETLAKKQQARTAEWMAELKSRAKLQSFLDDAPSGS